MTWSRLAARIAPMFVLLPLALSGCPDTKKNYDDFLEATEDFRGGDGDGDGDGMFCTDCDLSGTHLVAIDTVVLPATPLQFIADFEVDLDARILDATFTPLSLDMGSTTEPRVELPDNPIVVNGVPIMEDGTVQIDFGQVMVTGDANPITGSDITTTVVIDVGALDEDHWCGTASGMVTMPIPADLMGSTVAGIRLASRDDRPQNFPCEGEGNDKVCFTNCENLMTYMENN